MKRAGVQFLVAAAIAASWFGAACSAANAEPASVESYPGPSLEPICHASAERSLRPRSIFETPARLLAREARNLATTTNELAAVEVPSADQPSIATWLKDLRSHALLLMQTSIALKLDREPQARQFVRQLDYNAREANKAVSSLHFRYCILIAPRFREIRFNPKTLR